ncbi:MAG: hypothetical protein DMF04_07680 [Verrucomicrobia bacterium]|nr:MAG: hypothetical protein DMF04_07680 [Verrucomicrobiota bacterium]
MSTNIEGKVVVITRASSGLGESTAPHLAELGATVVLGARRKDRLDAIVKDITAKGGKALAVTVDVTKREQVDALIQAALKAYGKVDVLVNNAGIMPIARLAALKVDEWDKMIDINIKGVLYGIAAALNVKEFYKVAIPADSIARAIAYAIEQPSDVEIDEIVVRPTVQEF